MALPFDEESYQGRNLTPVCDKEVASVGGAMRDAKVFVMHDSKQGTQLLSHLEGLVPKA